ncbi:MAG: GNAT family N-acetyltransferase [Verrucomicrobia bacterium]|nr:GNAT family N-acetyltransferase [Verrucomicrobiota bacterium]
MQPEMMDRLWAAGWRHFGETFFRYSLSIDEHGVKTITPLRVDLEKFSLSKSQRRVLKKNADLRCEFQPASLSTEAREMFQRHKARFFDNVPEDLESFLSHTPASLPCAAEECRVYLGDELVALSYLDLGQTSTSAVYGMFEPAHSERSLGIYTLLREIEHTRSRGSRYYYPGYATLEPSAYDYKKRLNGLEMLDWQTGLWDDYPSKINPDTP